MSRWQIGLLIAAALILGAFKIYDKGKDAGRDQANAAYAKLLKEAQDKVEAKNAAIEQIALHQLAADQQRQSTHQEIVRESTKFIDRPVYRNRCMDADGLRILDDIAANAHGQNSAAPDDRPAAPAQAATRP
ncbi:hypothetical protein [Sphingopyxis yananensis]|uniref:hypothetical protein n=1 Tax=Sphingopyxis yananensis TaxID=2886687 RepID=UPI001D116042|nr:hypothetical protein [Sphingopyxis yananensis]MCC2602750.1 hypothetical protein [Sphingopyxis yananensis]